jgi:hypothetical protein
VKPTTLCRSRNTAHAASTVAHKWASSSARPPARRRVHAPSGTVRRRRTCGTTNRRGSALPTGKARPTCIYRVPLRVIYPDVPSHSFRGTRAPGFGRPDPETSVRSGPGSVRFDGVSLRLARWYRGATAVKRGITVDSCVAGVWVTLSKRMNRSATL